ncbi:MAG: oxidoreductase [Pseudomonadota bacterium]
MAIRKIRNSQIKNWRPEYLPDLSDRTFVVTGGNSGIGLEAARYLTQAGGSVVLACRSLERAEQAQQSLSAASNSTIETVELDLANLASVRSAAKLLRRRHKKIDGLINNAGIMQTPHRKTDDDFELQMGTNHLGHFLWTALLLDRVEAAAGRVVIVSSLVHHVGRLKLRDLMLDRGYTPARAYAQSKLANLMFAFELDRRLQATQSKACAVACHPGYSDTRLQTTGPGAFLGAFYTVGNKVLAQSSAKGAIPTVLAAAGTEALRGAYYGPTGFGGLRGPVSDAAVGTHALSEEKAARLWSLSEEFVDHRWLSE